MNRSEKFWDKASTNYDKTEERLEYLHKKTIENTKKYIKFSDIILDYGCGPGTKTCEIAKKVKEIHAIDISSKMIEIAKEKAVKNKIRNVNFVQATIFDKKYKKESFDVILAFNILHGLDDTQRVMQRLHELLKLEGLIISITPCLREKMSFLVNLQFNFFFLLSKIGIIPISIKRYRSSELDDLIVHGNFQIIETEKLYKGLSSYFIAAKKTYRT